MITNLTLRRVRWNENDTAHWWNYGVMLGCPSLSGEHTDTISINDITNNIVLLFT